MDFFDLTTRILSLVFIFILFYIIFSFIKDMKNEISKILIGSDMPERIFLEVVTTDDTKLKCGDKFIINKSISIGRSRKNDVILSDRFVSSKHLVISIDNNKVYAQDMGSTNGTKLQDKIILSREQVFDYTIIAVSNTFFKITREE